MQYASRHVVVCAGPGAAAARARHQLCGAPPGAMTLTHTQPTLKHVVQTLWMLCARLPKSYLAYCVPAKVVSPVAAPTYVLFARRCCQTCGLWHRRQLPRCPDQVTRPSPSCPQRHTRHVCLLVCTGETDRRSEAKLFLPITGVATPPPTPGNRSTRSSVVSGRAP